MPPSLFCKVLESKDLSKAGDLFAVDDSAIVEEFGEITNRIQVPRYTIITAPQCCGTRMFCRGS
jgi:hypothetical protein